MGLTVHPPVFGKADTHAELNAKGEPLLLGYAAGKRIEVQDAS